MTAPLALFAGHQRRRPPYVTDDGVRVVPVACKTELGVSRQGSIVHRVASAAAILSGDRITYAARWLCGAGCQDITLLANADAHGGCVCIRCRDVVPGSFVYRCFAADGRLLYIGSTARYGPRMQDHRSSALWWRQVADVTRESFGSLSAARAAERLAIRSERPAYNRQGVPA